jgi:hypothetical protein
MRAHSTTLRCTYASTPMETDMPENKKVDKASDAEFIDAMAKAIPGDSRKFWLGVTGALVTREVLKGVRKRKQ